MERESEQMQASQPPTLCRSGCGFYGSPATDNLCSICHKKQDALKTKQQPPSDARPPSVSTPLSQQQQQQQQSSPTAVMGFSPSPSSSMETAQPTVLLTPAPTTSSAAAAAASAELLAKDVESELDGVPSGASSVASGDRDEDASKLLDDSSSSDKDPSGKKRKNRCGTCRKKVGLTGFECRCGGLYCSLHRYSDMHECSFDYRELGAQEIRRNNPVVVGEKIQKI